MRALSWWVCWCALWASAAVSAGELPAGARVLFAPEPGDGALRIGGAQVELGRVERVAIDHEAAGAAYRVETRDAARQRWNLQLRGDLPVELRPGEVLLLTGYARCVSSTTGDGMFRVKVEQNADPWREGVARGFAFGPDWRRFDFPFVVPGSEPFRVGQTQLTFHVGEARQTIELAGVRLYGFEAWASVDDLPRTRVTYAGREAGAAWRAVAAERIERHRKADLTVRVVDAQGRGVAGASVRVAQRDHAFAFGAAFNLRVFTGGGADVPRYERAFVERFNSVVFENELKWYGPGLRDLSAVEAGLSFAEAHGLTTRGHVLVWPGRRRVPAEVVAMIDRLRAEPGDATTRAALADAVAERVRTVAGQLAGRIDDWDVVNEPFSNHDILDVLNPPGTPIGSGVMAEWFRMAHEADPDARLYLNDYGILAATSLEDAHLRSHYDTARRLLEAGAPLHGLGMQGHFGSSLTPPERLWEVLDLFAELGLSIKATEFDVNLDDPAVIADYTRDFYTALFAHPSVDGILSWGFWAGAHWRPDAAYLDRGFNPRPSDVALRRLLFETWWTDESATTDGQGEARVRGFHGAYEVTVALPGGGEVAETVELGADGAAVVLRVSE